MNRVGAVIVGGDFQGLGILRSLATRGIPTYLLDHDICIGRFSRYAKRFARCPEVKHEADLLSFLQELAQREDLLGWIIYPNDDDTVRFLARHKQELEKYYRIPTQSWDVIQLVYNKSLTYQLAETHGIPIPRTHYPHSGEEARQLDCEFPVILKPSVKEPFFSRTRKKAIRVNTRQELTEQFDIALSMAGGSGLLVQELIPRAPNQLFSVGSLYREGDFLGKVVAKRIRQHPMDFGQATTYAETMEIPELEDRARSILDVIGYRGLSEVEFMLDPRDNEYKLLEINARPWGWHSLAIAAGVDLPYLLYRDTLGETVRRNGFRSGVKWIRLTTDVPTAMTEMLKGNLSVTEYLGCFRGKKQFAVLSPADPIPFVAELLMIPYLWRKRGF